MCINEDREVHEAQKQEQEEVAQEQEEANSNPVKATGQPKKPPDLEDFDPITLGVQIYTKGISVNDQVICY